LAKAKRELEIACTAGGSYLSDAGNIPGNDCVNKATQLPEYAAEYRLTCKHLNVFILSV